MLFGNFSKYVFLNKISCSRQSLEQFFLTATMQLYKFCKMNSLYYCYIFGSLREMSLPSFHIIDFIDSSWFQFFGTGLQFNYDSSEYLLNLFICQHEVSNVRHGSRQSSHHTYQRITYQQYHHFFLVGLVAHKLNIQQTRLSNIMHNFLSQSLYNKASARDQAGKINLMMQS